MARATKSDNLPEDDADLTGLHVLMERYIDGDDAAFTQLHAQLVPRLRARLGRMVKNPALVDDLVQQTFMRAHAARDRFESVGAKRDRAVEGWYLAIARNVALDHMRQRYRSDRRHATLEARGELEGMGAPEAEPDPEAFSLELEASSERIERVRAAIDRLPRSQRDVVRLHKLGGLSMSEVADRLHARPGAIRVRAHRAYKTLADLLLGPPAQQATS